MKVGRLALIFTGCLEAGLYLILLGVFGGAALSDMQTSGDHTDEHDQNHRWIFKAC